MTEQEILTLPEHLISPQVFIEVHVVSLFHVIVLSFGCSFCLTAWYLYICYFFTFGGKCPSHRGTLFV